MEQPNTDANIQQGIAIYRKPQTGLPEFRVGDWVKAPVLTELNQDTFCLHPFSPSNSLELLTATLAGIGWHECSRLWEQYALQLRDMELPMSTSTNDFVQEVLGIQAAIENQRLQKAVAARSLTSHQLMDASKVWRAFESLHQAYPDAFVFLIIHPQWGCWLGASPETLLVSEGQTAKVMSLAGTLTQAQGGWTSKEALEQTVTSKYIAEVLAQMGVLNARESQVGEMQMGQIKHLMSEWHFQLPPLPELQTEKQAIESLATANERMSALLTLIHRLHPTPAVGGYPKAAAMDWLAENEVLDRQLYTGFVGVLGSDSVSVFVTLRCAQLYQNGYVLYAGCGVNAGSDPEVELQETSAKMQVLGQFLQ